MSILSEDLVEEILSRVPTTSLKLLRPTCKRWNALFNDHRFTKKHFEKAPKEFFVLVKVSSEVYSVSIDLRRIRDNIDLSVDVKGEFGPLKGNQISLISHCNGLLLCAKRTMFSGRSLMVYNPCMGQTRSIILRTDYDILEWFALGYQNNKSCSPSYKILRFGCVDNFDNFGLKFQIYEFSSNSWRVLDDVNEDWKLARGVRGVSLKGNTYWIASDIRNTHKVDSFLLKFDFTEEKFQRLRVPFKCYCDFDAMVLSTVREAQLALLFGKKGASTMEVWLTIKSDDPNDKPWRMLFRVDFDYEDILESSMSFMVDEKNKVALCCDRHMDIYGYRTRLYIVGEGTKFREVNLVGEGMKCREVDLFGDDAILPIWGKAVPILLSYVPSMVQI